MAVVLNIGLDLGGDTLKLAYSYEYGGKTYYGKIADSNSPMQIAIPSIAFYQEETKKWLFGYEVDDSGEENFVTVVKIKDLLSLLKKQTVEHVPVTGTKFQRSNAKRLNAEHLEKSAKITERNIDYYKNQKYFPKFHFPARKRMLTDFVKLVDESEVFIAPQTPREVCEVYFSYVRGLVDKFIQRLQKAKKVQTEKIAIALVHPPKCGDTYDKELARLVKAAFGVYPDKQLSSTKALSVFAGYKGFLQKGDDFLMFDLGEESISVIKGKMTSNNRLTVEGEAGHSLPIDIGGADVDEAVASYLEKEIKGRETMGSPSEGEEGHIYEYGLRSKQYLGIKYIKRAKTILSRQTMSSNSFAQGVPVSLIREVRIQKLLTREDFSRCLGINNNTHLAKKISDYIFQELEMPSNKDVRKIFLCGGLAETYGLKELIEGQGRKTHPEVQFCSFEEGDAANDGFTIQSYEDSVYASAVGASLASLLNYDLSMVFTYSYGTWFVDGNQKYFRIFKHADKGAEIKIASGQRWNDQFFTNFFISGVGADKEEIFSINITKTEFDEIENLQGKLYVGEIDSTQRKDVETKYGLETKAGGKTSEIRLFYKERRIRLPYYSPSGGTNQNRFQAREGIAVNAEGRVQPYVKNAYELEQNETANCKVWINYIDEKKTRERLHLGPNDDPNQVESNEIIWETQNYEIDSKDIKVEFAGVEEFAADISE